ncbi:hypothetical protein Glove_772g23 [Diversispora epigaea]|uniref:Uncharacterized protein n=1 Tax=Diversispora epigaea TaxID=1348612 RepID=A0A397FZB6_9GLOM|nr:hypothetical protein Glove_772g23 [Diversispora epigaea]
MRVSQKCSPFTHPYALDSGNLSKAYDSCFHSRDVRKYSHLKEAGMPHLEEGTQEKVPV